MKKWFMTHCGSGRTVFAEEVEFAGETKTQLKFRRKCGKIIKARKREWACIKDCHQVVGKNYKYYTIHLLDEEIVKRDNYITIYLNK